MLTREFMEKHHYKKLWFGKFRIFDLNKPIKLWISKSDSYNYHHKTFGSLLIIWISKNGTN